MEGEIDFQPYFSTCNILPPPKRNAACILYSQPAKYAQGFFFLSPLCYTVNKHNLPPLLSLGKRMSNQAMENTGSFSHEERERERTRNAERNTWEGIDVPWFGPSASLFLLCILSAVRTFVSVHWRGKKIIPTNAPGCNWYIPALISNQYMYTRTKYICQA